VRRRFPRPAQQRGNAAVEAALMLPIVVGAILIASDLYLVSRARGDLERSAATLSSILASQTELTANGLDELVDGVMGGRSDRYEIYVGQVWRSGEVAWSLSLGAAGGLCDTPFASSPYAGDLPERDAGDETESVAMLVVQACQESDALRLGALSLSETVLKSLSLDRMRSAGLELDETLRRRAGLPEDDE